MVKVERESGILANVAATPTPTIKKGNHSQEMEKLAAISNFRQGGKKRNGGKDKNRMKNSME